jgi:ribosome-binding ATPase
MKIGIVGLPFSGKTTLFNALTGSAVSTSAYAMGKSEAQHSIVKVPDERLDKLYAIFQPKKNVPATIEYLDLSGISADENKKGGFSDQFLGQIRTVDAILLILRHHKNDNVPHPLNTVDPVRDLQWVQSEFILSDLAIIENRMERLKKQMRVRKTDQDVKEHSLLEKFKGYLEEEKPLRSLTLEAEDELMVRGYQFLTQKPLIVVINIDEKELAQEAQALQPFSAWIGQPRSVVLPISARIEMEIQQLPEEEARVFREDAGIKEAAMAKLIRASYDLLGLLSFFTVGEDETRAWTIPMHTKAPQAAGEIHSDIERGFIRAEVVGYQDFIDRGNMAKCRSDAVLRLEGKEYIVQDGDIINFRFAT